jgi:hypothetical protein
MRFIKTEMKWNKSMRDSLKARLHRFLNELAFKLDTTKYLFDRPTFDYQPLPWVGIADAQIRGEATNQRWESIKGTIPPDAKTLKDIGCCVGFFCHKANEDLKLYSIGIDSDPRFIRIARYVATRYFTPEQETFLELQLNPDNVSILPNTDVTLLFSVWHHWVFDYGLENATKILKETWLKTNKIMYFESGEDEIAEEFNIDFEGNAKIWLRNYLESELMNSEIEIVGEFEAGNYDHYKLKKHTRSLYSIKRIKV